VQIAIIGAGMAGVSAAQACVAQGHDVTLFDKSRALGGRCATRRWEGHVVDHGAQYVTVRDERFRAALAHHCSDDLRRLEAPVVDPSGVPLPDDGRWYHRRGNRALVGDLAAGLAVKLDVTIERAASLLRGAGGDYDRVVSTAPLPQTAVLFDAPVVSAYVPCLTVLFAYRGAWLGNSRERYAVSDRDGPLAWSACENHKHDRVADGATVFVAQMSEAFSRAHLERSPDEYTALVRPLLEARWALPPSQLVATYGHRWRYARTTAPVVAPSFAAGLCYVGDALTQSRVESAWIAGAELVL
jgi:renalase